MIEPRIIYPCNHNYMDLRTSKRTIIVYPFNQKAAGANRLDDNLFLIPANYKLLSITRVYTLEPPYIEGALNDEDFREYYDEIDFDIDDRNNLLVWNTTTQGQGKPPSLHIEGIFNVTLTRTYTPTNCPRCHGMGWFGDIMNHFTKKHIVTGLEKLTQQVIKILLTERAADINTETEEVVDDYGTLLDASIRQTYGTPEEFSELLAEMITEAEVILKRLQDNAAVYGEIPLNERLSELEIVRIAYIESRDTFRIELIVHAVSGETSAFDFVL